MISSVRRGSRSRLLLALVLAALLVPSVAHAQRPASSPRRPRRADSVGMSAARLARLTAVFDKEIEDKKLPGAVMMVARKGKLVYASALGFRDQGSDEPMRHRRDLPHLLDDQADRLGRRDDPGRGRQLAAHRSGLEILPASPPSVSDAKVDATRPARPTARPAEREMTVQDLLRHTAGLAYGELTQNAPVKDALAKAGLFKPAVTTSTRAT